MKSQKYTNSAEGNGNDIKTDTGYYMIHRHITSSKLARMTDENKAMANGIQERALTSSWTARHQGNNFQLSEWEKTTFLGEHRAAAALQIRGFHGGAKSFIKLFEMQKIRFWVLVNFIEINPDGDSGIFFSSFWVFNTWVKTTNQPAGAAAPPTFTVTIKNRLTC